MDVLSNRSANLYQTGLLYNPQLQSAEMSEKLFAVRQKQFELLLNKILQEKENSIPQHYLIIGQRGIGKTTLLKRMEVELHKEQYRQRFIPLLYREEQYNVKDLAEFWLNTLDALADSLQSEKCPPGIIADIDKTIRERSGKPPKIIAEEAYKYLMSICDKKLHRRPVLLVDNIGLIFGRLDNDKRNKTEQWALRKLLSENGAPVVVGGGITLTDDVNNYGMPFYDFFQIQQLNKLNYEEFTKLLINLATVTNSDKTVFAFIQENSFRQKSLLELTGGSPRLTVMLFEQIAKGFSSNIYNDLEILADTITPLYKARFEELPAQQQIILDAIALNWDAISLNKLAKATRMQNHQLSPQLKRLVDDGWLETTPAYKAKGNAYFISERFFNIYYLIRNSSRRHKDKIYCLSRFLEYFYGKEELDRMSDILSKQDIHSSKEMQLQMAFWNIKILDKQKQQQGLENISKAFLESEELRKEFDFSEEDFLFEEGKKLFTEEKYQEAIVCYNKAIELNPNDENAWCFKGKCLSDMQRYEEAIVCYNKAIELNSNNEDTWGWKGKCLFYMQQYEEAIVCFNKIIELNPNDENAWGWKGKCLFFLQRHEEAIICFNKAIELNPNNEDIWGWKANCLSAIQQYEEATVCFNKAIELNSNNEYAWNWKGKCLFFMRQYEEAIVCYDKAIELNSNDENAWGWKANCLSAIQQYEEAIVCYNKAIELNSNDEDIWGLKGKCLFFMQRYEEAIVCCNKAIELNSNNEYAWYFKGKCLLELERYEEAIKCYDKATELDENYQAAWNDKGFALIEVQCYEEATLAYEKSSSIYPQELLPKFHLIFLYRDKLEKRDKAIKLHNSMEKDINVARNKKYICRFYLDKTLFELYKRNEGLAKEHLLRAFEVLEKENELSSMANDYYWIIFGSVIINLGYSSWLLAVLKEKGYDIVLSPYYTAIQALEIEAQDNKNGKENAEIYLKNVATEICAPARIIIDKMRGYM